MYKSKVSSKDTDQLFKAIMSMKSVEECYRFFDDLCTIGEILSMTQRYQVAKMLREGDTFNQISEKTGASSATITRVNKCLGYGSGGYDLALEREKRQ